MLRKSLFGLVILFGMTSTAVHATPIPIIGPGGFGVIQPDTSYEITDLTSSFGGVVAVQTGENDNQQAIFVDHYDLFVVGDLSNGIAPLAFNFSALNAFGSDDPVGLGGLTFTLRDTGLGPLADPLSVVTLTDENGALIPNVLSTFIFPATPALAADLTLDIVGTILTSGSSYSVSISTVPLPLPLALLFASLAGLVAIRRRNSDT